MMRHAAIARWSIIALIFGGGVSVAGMLGGAIAPPAAANTIDPPSETSPASPPPDAAWDIPDADYGDTVFLYPEHTSDAPEPILIYPDPETDSEPSADAPIESPNVKSPDDDEILLYPDVTDPVRAPSDQRPELTELEETPSLAPPINNQTSPAHSEPTVAPQTEPIVTDIQIQGADAELQQILRDVIQVRLGRPLTTAQIDADQVALKGTGLIESVMVSTDIQSDGVAVIYRVEPIVVRSLELTGSQVLPPNIIDTVFAAQINQPISPRLLNQGADDIDAWYLENGYSLSRVVAWLTEPSGHVIIEVTEPTIGDIAIEFVEEGSRIGADGDPVEGRTREDFILRELSQEPGDVFNQNDLVRDMETLLSLGIFQDASVELIPHENPDEPTVDVLYRLEEGFARSFRVGGGISTELGLFGSVNYQDRNFRGIGEEVNLGVQAGGRGLEFNTGFTSPYRDSAPNRLGYSINGFRRSSQSLTFSDEVPLANGDDARERRFGGGASVMRPLGAWDAELGIDYARVSIRDDDGDIATEDALGNALTASDSGIDDLLTLGFRVTQDRRLNPNNPAGGSVLSLATEQSVPIGSGNILMNRLTASYARYLPTDLFGSGSLRNPEVFAFNVQGGTVLGDLPPYEAFDLGGMNSVRGYGGGDVGSGRSYILAAAEYRFPLISTLGGVLFADFASDLGSGNSVEGDPAGSRDKTGTGVGYGFGLRFGSPIGLIRADFGFNDRGENQFHFGFGQRF